MSEQSETTSVGSTPDEPPRTRMRLVDARRLTGPNLLARSPLVLASLALDADTECAEARAVYLSELARMRVALGLPAEVSWLERPHDGGAVIAYAEPIDVLLACTEMSEWAALSACELFASRPPLPLEPKRAEIDAMLERDRNAALLALEREAARRRVPLLWDDERVSLGTGSRSESWPRHALPETGDVPWDRLGRIPVALVTGTNGKTTSTRLLTRIAREAQKRVGATSSDSITVGGDVIEQGDWTGPVAARLVLRRADVDFAVLETARGGILRRGLAVDACDVALITNVSDDHLGGYGIDDLDALARAKAVTLDAALPDGTAVLNARDPRLVALAAGRPRVVFFADLDVEPSGSAAHTVLERHRAANGDVVFTSAGRILHGRGDEQATLATIADVPITFGGAARFNVENVLGVVGAAIALGLPRPAIARALATFGPNENPRRSMLVERDGARLMLDFGHNPEGVRAVMQLVCALRDDAKGRLTIITGSAGDRSDRDIGEIARVVHEVGPDRVIVRDLTTYLRGRAPGEVPEVFRRALLALGVPPDAIATAESEVDALRQALANARPGDFIVLLVHVDEDEVRAFLAER